MRVVTVQPGEVITLGYQYDNEATRIIFPSEIISPIPATYGAGGSFAIWYRRSGDALGYPIGYPLVQYANDTVTWDITEAELANPGTSQVQLRYIVDDVCVMSQIFPGNVADSVDIGSDIPEPMEAWADIIVKSVNGLAATGLSPDIKEALLDCFEHVAWVDEHGQDYVDALEAALYPPAVLTSITAYYNQTGTIYDTDDLDDLRPNLTVLANYDNGQSVPVTTYTLTGNLVAGTSTIRVNFDTKYTTFDVTVTHMPGIISVVNNLVNATNSNSATTVSEGDSYTATISPASGYTLTGASVTVMMGSTNITSTAYNNGAIYVDEVTDTLTISVVTVAVTLVSISAVYTQSGTVYDTATLDSLKTDLVVTASWSAGPDTTVASSDYTLSGTLEEGTSTITVSYGGKTTTFTVTVSSTNLFKKADATQSKAIPWGTTTGAPENATSGWGVSDYIAIESGKSYRITLPSPTSYGEGQNNYNIFDTSKVWQTHGDMQRDTSVTPTIKYANYTATADGYLRFNFYWDYLDDVRMVEV